MRPFFMGFRDLRTHWIQHLITALGMVLGVLGVVAIAVTSSVAADMLIAQQEQLNGREASFSNELNVAEADLDLSEGASPLTDFYQSVIERIGPQNANVVAQSETSMILKTANEKLDNLKGSALPVTWVLGEINSLQRMPVLVGVMPHPSTYPPELAINESAAQSLGVSGSATFYVSVAPTGPNTLFTISAIVADGQQRPMAYGAYETAMELYPVALAKNGTTIRVRAAPDRLSNVNSILVDAARYQGFTFSSTTTRVDTVESVRTQVMFFSWVFGACAGLVLVISAMATASVGIASVAERSRELVVRRAVGARRRDIFVQVMSASLGVGMIVAAIAVVAAIAGVYWVVPSLIPAASSIIAPTFPWFACTIGISSALLTSVVGAILPAVKATRLPVALALRE